MTNSANAFAFPVTIMPGSSSTSYDVAWNGAVSDGVSQSSTVIGCFSYDTTQSVGANTCAFKASVAAAALAQAGLTIPVSNILVIMGVY